MELIMKKWPSFIVSPGSNRALEYISEHGNSSFRTADEPIIDYEIIDGIPLLISGKYVADWWHNVLEIVIGPRTREVVNEIIEKYGKTDRATAEIRNYVANEVGKGNVMGLGMQWRRFETTPG